MGSLKCRCPKCSRTLGSRVSGLVRVSGLCCGRPVVRTNTGLMGTDGVDGTFFAGDNARTVRNTLGTTGGCTCMHSKRTSRRVVTVGRSFRKEDVKTLSIAKATRCERPFRPLVNNIGFTSFGGLRDMGTRVASGAYTVVARIIRNRNNVCPTGGRFLRNLHRVYSRGSVVLVFSRVRYNVKEAKRCFT